MNPDFDLPAFLLGKLYDNMDWENGWTLADAIALAEDIRRYDGIDPPDDGWEAPSRNALRQLGGARRGKPAGAMLLNTMGGYHHEDHAA